MASPFEDNVKRVHDYLAEKWGDTHLNEEPYYAYGAPDFNATDGYPPRVRYMPDPDFNMIPVGTPGGNVPLVWRQRVLMQVWSEDESKLVDDVGRLMAAHLEVGSLSALTTAGFEGTAMTGEAGPLTTEHGVMRVVMLTMDAIPDLSGAPTTKAKILEANADMLVSQETGDVFDPQGELAFTVHNPAD